MRNPHPLAKSSTSTAAGYRQVFGLEGVEVAAAAVSARTLRDRVEAEVEPEAEVVAAALASSWSATAYAAPTAWTKSASSSFMRGFFRLQSGVSAFSRLLVCDRDRTAVAAPLPPSAFPATSTSQRTAERGKCWKIAWNRSAIFSTSRYMESRSQTISKGVCDSANSFPFSRYPPGWTCRSQAWSTCSTWKFRRCSSVCRWSDVWGVAAWSDEGELSA
mmetsp:Transcript_24390/g.61314  ORF Transcript_24390/g.61314 Transcript_24390/m.61314 type:complete len:218 (-) Transcript_24390:1303-1956(-)